MNQNDEGRLPERPRHLTNIAATHRSTACGRLTDLQTAWLNVRGGLLTLRENLRPDVWYSLVWQINCWSGAELQRLKTSRAARKWAA